MPEFPSMPEVNVSIQMPEISSPSVSSSNFYVPNFQNGNNSVRNSQSKASGTEKKETDGKTSAESNGISGFNSGNKGKTSISDVTTDLYSSVFGNANLTASDISGMYDAGLFGNISSLASTNNGSVNTALLQQILAKLDELKASQNNATIDEKNKIHNQQIDSQVFQKRNASILRFRINGHNVTDSLTKVFFSESEPDGTFMLTGDRKYYINRMPRTETFYFLFKAEASNGAVVTYRVIPSLVQDAENQNSFIYKFCQQQDLTAEKTGNLVVLHSAREGFAVDLLLDIDAE